MSIRHPSFLLFTLFFFSLHLKAQDSIPINNIYWFDFMNHLHVSDMSEIYGDLSYRYGEQENKQVFMIRPGYKFQATPIFSIHVGIGLFYTEVEDSENSLETRIWEGFRLGWPDIGPLHFKNYLRFEQRNVDFIDKNNIYQNRVRYEIKTKVPLNKRVVQDDAIYIPIGFEWLGSTDGSFKNIWASQSRAKIGIGYVISKEWQIETEYMYWWRKDLPSDIFQATDQIFRIIIHRNGWISGE